MSNKCFATITLYTFFLAFMLGTAYIFSYMHFENLIAKIVIIIALILVSTALALTVERGAFITVVFNAILWGTALSFLFDHLGSPDPLHIIYVALAMVSWFVLFCFLTNFSFIKENYSFSMVFWGVILAIADIIFTVHINNVLGWTALIILLPFITFFTALPGDAEDFTEHTHHIAIYCTLPALLLVMLLLFFRVPIGSFEKDDFFPEVDDDYIFVYSPKTHDDEDNHTKEDLSELM